MSFTCTQCGACCRRAGQLPGFPLPVNPDGSCSKLVNNLCSIYADRPAICRHGHSRAAFGMTPEEYDRFTARICNLLQEADDIDPSYRLKTD